MPNTIPELEEVLALALQLSPLDKIKLIGRLAPVLENDLTTTASVSLRSLYGILADLAPAPSAQDIDEARQEAWNNFPTQDIN